MIGLYDRFGYHPGLLDESAELLQYMKIIELGGDGGE